MSGGVTFNDCFFHAGAKDAPFGGVGASGMGYYHGHYGVLAFSHLRTYINGLPAWMESVTAFRYPPYTAANVDKMSPRVKPSFDRDGNDVWKIGPLTKYTVGLGGLAAVYIFRKTG
jgi:aldehyde dehydrogenase (NAD+)